MSTQTEAHATELTVYIDAKPYKIKGGTVAVKKLRRLPAPPVPEGKDLWLDIDDAQDQLLDDEATVEIVDGMRFFTEIEAITIRIDRAEYEVFKRKMTGAELRVVPTPDVAADRDLWRDVPDKRDVKVQDEDIVLLEDGTRFFTAPGRINPGALS
jgi:hypothetical protein